MKTILDAYRVLGLPPGVPLRLVKRTYRNLVKQWHPDRFANFPARRSEAEERIKLINLAFEQVQQQGELLALAIRAQQMRRPPSSTRESSPSSSETKTKSPRSRRSCQHGKSAMASPLRKTTLPRKQPPPGGTFARTPSKARILATLVVSIALGVLTASTLSLRANRTLDRLAPRQPQLRADSASRLIAPTPVPILPDFATVDGIPSRANPPEPESWQLGAQQVSKIGWRTESPPESKETETLPSWNDPELRTESRIPGQMPRMEFAGGIKMLARIEQEREERKAASLDQVVRADLGEKYFRIASQYLAEKPPDYETASKYLRLAGEQGHAQAQRNLALLYASGQGVEQDRTRAQEWLRESALRGDVNAGVLAVLIGLTDSTKPALPSGNR